MCAQLRGEKTFSSQRIPETDMIWFDNRSKYRAADSASKYSSHASQKKMLLFFCKLKTKKGDVRIHGRKQKTQKVTLDDDTGFFPPARNILEKQ